LCIKIYLINGLYIQCPFIGWFFGWTRDRFKCELKSAPLARRQKGARKGAARYVAMRLDVTDVTGGIRGVDRGEGWEGPCGRTCTSPTSHCDEPSIGRRSKVASKAHPALVIQFSPARNTESIEIIESIIWETTCVR